MLKRIYRKFRASIADILIAWLPALVLFVLIPFSLYLPNQPDYNYDLRPVTPALLMALVSLFVLCGLTLFKEPTRRTIALPLFYLGVFLALSDTLAPLSTGLLEDDTRLDLIAEPLRLTVIQLAVALGVIICAIKVPPNLVRKCGPVMVLALVCSEVFIVCASLSPHTTYPLLRRESGRRAQTRGNMPQAKTGNVYQIVFDGYSSCAFLASCERAGLLHRFEGFTFFQANRANYAHTFVSYPSYMTGTVFDGRSLHEWLDRALNRGLVERMYNSGYTISFYTPWMRLVHRRASTVRTWDASWFNTNFARLWLVRVSPNMLRQEASQLARSLGQLRIARSRGPGHEVHVSRAGRENSPTARNSMELLRDFLRDEAHRPSHGQYVYLHLNIPHPPYRWDAECQPVGKSDYISNLGCATRLMAEIVRRLKELGKFENSLIIFHSDHGWERDPPPCRPDPPTPMPVEIEERVRISTNNWLNGERFLLRTEALLLVKPPGAAKKPLIVSDVPTQLLDIPATVCHLMGLTPPSGEGKSVFTVNSDEPREIHFFSGYKRVGENKGFVVLGKHFRSTELRHFSYVNGVGWKLYPPIPAQASGGKGFSDWLWPKKAVSGRAE